MSQIASQADLQPRTGLLERALGLPSANTVMIAAAGLLCIGAIMVLSAQSWRQVVDTSSEPQLLNKATFRQAAFVAAAMVAMVGVSRIDYRWYGQPWWLGIRPAAWLLLASTVLVGLTLVPGIGSELNGARRWLPLGLGLSFQPSELAKIALVLWLAERFGSGRRDIRNFWTGLLPAGVVVAVVCGLIALEDFGTAALMGVASLGVLTVAGMHWVYFGGLVGAAALGVYGLIMMEPYRLERIRSFQNIWADARGRGYQPVQSLLAIAAGGWTGVGFGQGIQKFGYLPETPSDFIFALVCEELGFLGAMVVIVLFAVIVWQGACVVYTCRDNFARLAAFGIAATVGMQAAMNIAVVTVLVPTKGISLPLVSAGGTSLIVTAASIGILASIARHAQGEADEV